MIERPRSQILACVTADGHACSLIDHAHHLATALSSNWAVLYIEDAVAAGPASDSLSPCPELRSALQAAALAGAAISSVLLPAGRTRRAALLATVAANAQAQNATTVLVGWPGRANTARSAVWSAPGSAHVASPGPFTQRLNRALPGVTVHVIGDSSATPATDAATGADWWRGIATALAVLGLCTLLSALLEPTLEPANLIMVYLAGVVYVALQTSRPVALLTVIGSVLLYDLLFIAPSGPLKPSEPHYVLVSVVMLLVGFIVSQLAARSRQQAAMAELRAERAQALNHLALELVKARSPASIGTALAFAVHRTLGASAQLLPVDANGLLACAGDSFAPQARLARAALQQRCDTGAGTAVEPEQRYRCLPLLTADGALGVVAVDLLSRQHDAQEDRQLLRASANQAAVALERAVFESRSASAAVQAEGERLRSTLLAGVSHDFRTPLTTIVGAATSLLQQGHALPAAQRTALLRSVLAEARRMHLLTSNLLDLTRMGEGAIRPNLEWCPADEMVEEARAALASRLEAHAVTVVVAPDAVVWCDPRLVGQLLMNLLDNATRHAPGAAIAITVRAAPGSWQLEVQDDGPGVPVGQETEVFKKFYRGKPDADSDTHTGTGGGGTGLGLAICAAVAHLHGGTLAVHAVHPADAVQDGTGARFVLSLPQPLEPPLTAAELAEAE